MGFVLNYDECKKKLQCFYIKVISQSPFKIKSDIKIYRHTIGKAFYKARQKQHKNMSRGQGQTDALICCEYY